MTLSAAAFAQKKAAVYVTGDAEQEVKEVFGSEIVYAITKSGVYSAVERSQRFLSMLNKEFDYELSGEVDAGQISQIGRQLGVDYVFVINMQGQQKTSFISARIINVTSGVIIASTYSCKEITDLESLKQVSQEIGTELLSKDNPQTNQNKAAVYAAVGKGIHNTYAPVLESVAISLFTEYASENQITIIERSNDFLHELSKEHDYQQSGAVDDEQIRELGKKFGVKYVVAIDAKSVLGSFHCSSRIIDVTTGDIIRTGKSDDKDLSDVSKICQLAENSTYELINSKNLNLLKSWKEGKIRYKMITSMSGSGLKNSANPQINDRILNGDELRFLATKNCNLNFDRFLITDRNFRATSLDQNDDYTLWIIGFNIGGFYNKKNLLENKYGEYPIRGVIWSSKFDLWANPGDFSVGYYYYAE